MMCVNYTYTILLAGNLNQCAAASQDTWPLNY